jgi:MFS family permease
MNDNTMVHTSTQSEVQYSLHERTVDADRNNNDSSNNNNVNTAALHQHPLEITLPTEYGYGVAGGRLWILIRRWLVESVWPGMGLFGESYMLFSIGTLTPLWRELYPDCFDNQDCKPRLLYSLTYSVVLGVIVGMITLGYAANMIGRRRGSLLTAGLMSGGAVAMVVESMILTGSVVALYRSMVASLFVFGIGVGGEYPLSASLASERAMQSAKQPILSADDSDKADPLITNQDERPPQDRGRQVQLVFSMQGMGIWFNSLTMAILLYSFGQTSADNYDHRVLMMIWRITYAIGACILCTVLVTRYLYLEESKVWSQDKKRIEEGNNCIKKLDESVAYSKNEKEMPQPEILSQNSTVSELSNPTVTVEPGDLYMDQILEQSSSASPADASHLSHGQLLWRNFGGRLFGASTAWLLWDISFYGNKLFQSTFILALTGKDTTLFEFAVAATLNATVALLGYFGAAILVESPRLGRVKLQSTGFLVTGFLFLACGFFFDLLSSGWLVALYLASSFFGQLGPNATTFLIPAEIFPTEQRTYCHGICSASGKVGALIAAVLFHFVPSNVDLFLICGYASFLACFITYYFIPETFGLNLLETDMKWHMTLEGRKREYQGPANHPDFLSMYEKNWFSGISMRGTTHATDWDGLNLV